VETLDAYLDALASERPTPGGGSAATIVGALAAALVAMVARITFGNAKLAAHGPAAAELTARADALRAELLRARTEDERAFGAVVAAQALPKTTADERAARAAALQTTLGEAAAAPLHAAGLALDVLRLSDRGLELENRNLASDLGCAAELAAAALAAAAYNVRANHPYMRDASRVETQTRELTRLEGERDALLARVRAALQA
jgi:formiminotetrahydrofolate cyclodeaminase